MRKVSVSEPVIGETEIEYVNRALAEGAISGLYGDYIRQFEDKFADYSDCAHGISTNSGTTALHLAIKALSIGDGDEVIASTLTNMATFFAIIYQGAKPVPVDIEEDTWNLDPDQIESKINRKTKAIMVVHLFGHPVDMDPVLQLAKTHGLYVIEDGAEAHGATYMGRKIGSLGDLGCFSFYANKIITTGEGGMVTTNDPDLAEKVRSLKGLAFGQEHKFMHMDIGCSYRMTNLQAAIGCAQLEKIEYFIRRKREIADIYKDLLGDIDCLQLPTEKEYARNVYWMYHVGLLGEAAINRKDIMGELSRRGVETREGFIPYNMQEIFVEKGWVGLEECPKANEVAYSTFYLPSSPSLVAEDLEYVAENLREVLKGFRVL